MIFSRSSPWELHSTMWEWDRSGLGLRLDCLIQSVQLAFASSRNPLTKKKHDSRHWSAKLLQSEPFWECAEALKTKCWKRALWRILFEDRVGVWNFCDKNWHITWGVTLFLEYGWLQDRPVVEGLMRIFGLEWKLFTLKKIANSSKVRKFNAKSVGKEEKFQIDAYHRLVVLICRRSALDERNRSVGVGVVAARGYVHVIGQTFLGQSQSPFGRLIFLNLLCISHQIFAPFQFPRFLFFSISTPPHLSYPTDI